MINMNLEDLRYLTQEDMKAMNDLRAQHIPDEIIQKAYDETVKRAKEGKTEDGKRI